MTRKIRRNRRIKAKRRIRLLGGINPHGGFRIAVGLAALVALSVFLIFCHDVITQCAVFEAEKISVTGGERLTEAEILAQARIDIGMNILGLNLSIARKRLLAHPWIAAAEIRREIPDGLAIRIREHHPLAVIDLGRKFLIDESGAIFKERDDRDPPNIPWVHGLRFSDLQAAATKRGKILRPSAPKISSEEIPTQGSIYDAVIRALSLGLHEDRSISKPAIHKILVDRELGLTLITARRRTAIKLGFDEFPLKYKMLQDIFEFLEQGRFPELSDVATIDLKNLNRVVLNPMAAGNKADG
jgi:cell division protein FtsQ